jgi:hypothetical protein
LVARGCVTGDSFDDFDSASEVVLMTGKTIAGNRQGVFGTGFVQHAVFTVGVIFRRTGFFRAGEYSVASGGTERHSYD